MKQQRKLTRARLRKIAGAAECERLRAKVEQLARSACEDSRIGKCINRYTQFAIEPDGSVSCGHKPLKKLNRLECRDFISTRFEPVDMKGPIELFVDRVNQADRSPAMHG